MKPIMASQSNVGQQQNIIIQSNANAGNSANIVISGQTLKVHSNILAQVIWKNALKFKTKILNAHFCFIGQWESDESVAKYFSATDTDVR